MVQLVYKQYYTRFLAGAPERLHFAGHSHHYWPDVTRDAMLACWDDAATYADSKWSHIFSEVVPKAQAHIARTLATGAPKQIVFAPNTHEFINRLISCFDTSRRSRILSTDSEFHSFGRQSARLLEAGRIELDSVPSQPIEDFAERFTRAAKEATYDLIFVSHVFFNSGQVVEDLPAFLSGLPGEPMLVVDGYHGFCALPTDLGPVAHRIFYLAGGYKYAQSGEGVCFMHVPEGCQLRPVDTGWFAYFPGLAAADRSQVQYSDDGMRFAGATIDVSGIYRFNAVMDLWQREGIDVPGIHAYVRGLIDYFLARLDTFEHPLLQRSQLIYRPGAEHGHFLTFVLPSEQAAAVLTDGLAERQVVVDRRGDRVRIGFGMYLMRRDIDRLFERLPR
jgi:selenocysteine lyase/cysteine desulfurase